MTKYTLREFQALSQEQRDKLYETRDFCILDDTVISIPIEALSFQESENKGEYATGSFTIPKKEAMKMIAEFLEFKKDKQ